MAEYRAELHIFITGLSAIDSLFFTCLLLKAISMVIPVILARNNMCLGKRKRDATYCHYEV
jgi:hypothetical protein